MRVYTSGLLRRNWQNQDMNDSDAAPDRTWAALTVLPETARSAAIRERFSSLLVRSRTNRQLAIRQMMLAEYELADEELANLVRSRLLALSALRVDEARVLVGDYEAVLADLTSEISTRLTRFGRAARRSLTADQRDAVAAAQPLRAQQVAPGAGAPPNTMSHG